MQKEEITNRVASDKISRESREDMRKPSKRKAKEDRRKVDRRRSIEEIEIEKQARKADNYE